MDKRLVELRELTQRLTEWSTKAEKTGYVEVKTEAGTSFLFNLINSDGVAVSETYFSPGTRYPVHSHRELEVYVVYAGTLTLKIGNDPEVTLTKGDVAAVQPNVPHSASTSEECRAIYITIPASKSLPDDER